MSINKSKGMRKICSPEQIIPDETTVIPIGNQWIHLINIFNRGYLTRLSGQN